MSSESVKPPSTPLPLDKLSDRIGLEIPNIKKAREAAKQKQDKIREVVKGIDFPTDTTSLVVFGSLARLEWTSGSDVDWTLLVDGPADPQHFSLVGKVKEELESAEMLEPGASGMFAALASSHELVHNIGGDSDSNANMTRRTLLLLESTSINSDKVRQRVVRAILDRYIVYGPSVDGHTNTSFRSPRFLLNDVVRLWRTFAVDYAAKKWQQSDDKWALRNAKLRVPRKLTFVKGLLLCMDCELFTEKEPWHQSAMADSSLRKAVMEKRLLEGCFTLLQHAPLDALARVCDQLQCDDTAKEIFESYDNYLALIDDPEKRKHLKNAVKFENADGDSVFQDVRKISHRFGGALEKLFFDENNKLTELTRKYGVF